MELIALVIAGVLAAVVALAGVTATLIITLRDGYRARPLQSSYDSRRPL